MLGTGDMGIMYLLFSFGALAFPALLFSVLQNLFLFYFGTLAKAFLVLWVQPSDPAPTEHLEKLEIAKFMEKILKQN